MGVYIIFFFHVSILGVVTEHQTGCKNSIILLAHLDEVLEELLHYPLRRRRHPHLYIYVKVF